MKLVRVLLCMLLCALDEGHAQTYTLPTSGNLNIAGATSGYILSPSYPSLYPNNVNVTATITASGVKTFVFSANSFDVEETSTTSGCYDKVSFVTVTNGFTITHGPTCGRNVTAFPTFYFINSQVQLKFTSDSSVQRNGFQIYFRIYDQSGVPTFALPVTGALYLGDIPEGYITSPNFPSSYPNGASSYVNFYTTAVNPKSATYTFTSAVFDVESTGLYCDDKVLFGFFEQGRTSPTVYGPYCGTSFSSLSVNNNALTLSFTSDSSVQRSGFKLFFKSNGVPQTPSTCGVPSITPCLPRPSTNRLCPSHILRIIGGNEALPNSYPWQALLVKYVADVTKFCGATIIGSQWLLTSAGCIDFLGSTGILVRVGAHRQNEVRIGYAVQGIYKHPLYRQGSIDYNVALIKLYERIMFNSTVSPVCLDKSVGTDYSGQSVVATGWGSMNDSGRYLPIGLQEVELIVNTSAACSAAFGSNITPRSFCASAFRKGICFGDAGGPLVRRDSSGRYWLVGISSAWSSIGCTSAGKPSIFIKVSEVSSWISQYVV